MVHMVFLHSCGLRPCHGGPLRGFAGPGHTEAAWKLRRKTCLPQACCARPGEGGVGGEGRNFICMKCEVSRASVGCPAMLSQFFGLLLRLPYFCDFCEGWLMLHACWENQPKIQGTLNYAGSKMQVPISPGQCVFGIHKLVARTMGILPERFSRRAEQGCGFWIPPIRSVEF